MESVALHPLDAAILSVAEDLSESRLALDLQRFAPGVRAAGASRIGAVGLADFELSLGPPIGRAMHVMESIAATQQPLPHDEMDREYLAWVEKVHAFLGAVVQAWWEPIRPDIYTLFVDEDDLPAFATSYITGLREKHPTKLSSTAAAIGLVQTDVARWGSIGAVCRASTVFAEATKTSDMLRGSRKEYGKWLSRRSDTEDELLLDKSMRLGEARTELRAKLAGARDHATHGEWAMQQYNALVQACLASVLGLLESTKRLEPVTSVVGALDAEPSPQGMRVSLTTADDLMMIKPRMPFVLRLGGPLDGIYLCDGMSMRFGEVAGLISVSGRRVSDLCEMTATS